MILDSLKSGHSSHSNCESSYLQSGDGDLWVQHPLFSNNCTFAIFYCLFMDSVGHKYSEIESQKLYIHTYSLVFIDLHIMHTVIFSANNNWDCISKVS